MQYLLYAHHHFLWPKKIGLFFFLIYLIPNFYSQFMSLISLLFNKMSYKRLLYAKKVPQTFNDQWAWWECLQAIQTGGLFSNMHWKSNSLSIFPLHRSTKAFIYNLYFKKPYLSALGSFKTSWSEYFWRGDLCQPKSSHTPGPSFRAQWDFVSQFSWGLALPQRNCLQQSFPDFCIPYSIIYSWTLFHVTYFPSEAPLAAYAGSTRIQCLAASVLPLFHGF